MDGFCNVLRNIVRTHSFLDDLVHGRKPKKCIIFCRSNSMLGEVYGRLMELTNFKYTDCRDSPFVLNHSSLLPPSIKVLADRSSEISLYLSSNKMLLGIDLADIDIVIFLRPYDQPSALVQGGGRGGRKLKNGKRKLVQVYQLFNAQDIGSGFKNMSSKVREICLSKECTRSVLKKYFVGGGNEAVNARPTHCCHNCDMNI